MIKLYPQITSGLIICDKCRKDSNELKNTQPSNAEGEDSSGWRLSHNQDPDSTISNSMVVQTLNTSLQELGESLIDKKTISSRNFEIQIKSDKNLLINDMIAAESSLSDSDMDIYIDKYVLQNLKTNFLNSTRRVKNEQFLHVYLKIGLLGRSFANLLLLITWLDNQKQF